jgi:hypothetical protein
MAGLLIEARDAAREARAGGKKLLDLDVLGDLVDRYRAIATSGLAANVYRRTATAKDARRIARRFLKHEDMILRFMTRPDLDIFTNYPDVAVMPMFAGGGGSAAGQGGALAA